jgi:hypothetical protein
MTEHAIMSTRADLRSCWHYGLRADPTQEGHVALVMRVDGAGRVAAVEPYGACVLAAQTLRCLRDVALRVRFDPPEGGSATVTLPAVFSERTPTRRPPARNDAYAAAAFIAIESVRPSLHTCEQTAKAAGNSIFASATMTIDVDGSGHGVHVSIDPWQGDPDLLKCAAQVMRGAPFPKPPAGRAQVVTSLTFNPR